jgi:hypothetical protein
MTAFAHGWRCAGTAPARCLAERFMADGSASDGWRMREWQLFCAIGHQLREACYSPRMTCVEPLSPRERDAGADLATVQKMVGHESVATTAGYDRRGDAAKRKAADLVHVLFLPRQA